MGYPTRGAGWGGGFHFRPSKGFANRCSGIPYPPRQALGVVRGVADVAHTFYRSWSWRLSGGVDSGKKMMDTYPMQVLFELKQKRFYGRF